MDLFFDPIGLLPPLIVWIVEYIAVYALLRFAFRTPANQRADRLFLIAFLLSVLVTTVLGILFYLKGGIAPPPHTQRTVIGRLITLFILSTLPMVATAIATWLSLRFVRSRTIVSLIAVFVASIFISLFVYIGLVLVCTLAGDCI
jgi:hypothetical protein